MMMHDEIDEMKSLVVGNRMVYLGLYLHISKKSKELHRPMADLDI